MSVHTLGRSVTETASPAMPAARLEIASGVPNLATCIDRESIARHGDQSRRKRRTKRSWAAAGRSPADS